jgi:NitT/TauT family transport system ATP-binding protein
MSPNGGPSTITLEDVRLSYPAVTGRDEVPVLDGISLDVGPGSFVCLIGTSGCGKSTLLSLIAGYIAPTVGRVLVDGQIVKGPASDRIMVFQHPALFPWCTAAENVGFGLGLRAHKARGNPQATIDALLNLVGLKGFGDRYPFELSGGMRQRVEIARALAVDPRVLLMDEPFGALDALSRLSMQREMLRIWEETGKTIVFVTHDIEEAVVLGDKVVVLSQRPATVKEVLNVALPRPRLREDPKVVAFAHHIATLLEASF